jgi:hypothetical protein
MSIMKACGSTTADANTASDTCTGVKVAPATGTTNVFIMAAYSPDALSFPSS